MTRTFLISAAIVLVAFSLRADDSPLAGIDRTIEREPEYHQRPRYALMVLGAEAKAGVAAEVAPAATSGRAFSAVRL